MSKTSANSAPVIAIDGPSGVGKGTLCRLLAEELGWHLLDSGALYRLAALAALRHQIPLDDGLRLAELVAELDIRFAAHTSEATGVYLDGIDVSLAMRGEACANAASKVAALQPVRDALLQRQRDFRQAPGLIADGRDMGTVVFPDAEIKFFLTASPKERAMRRYKQLKEQGVSASLAALAEEIAERDERDQTRAVSPLKPASDAILLDTTGMSIEEVKRHTLGIVRNNL